MPKECGNSQPAACSTGRLLRARLLPSCGDDGVRTRDLVVANHALSQLSYIPVSLVLTIALGVLGFEPRTSALSELRSSQLSYTPRGAKQKAKPNGLALSSRSVRIERQHPLLFARDPLAIDTVLEDANKATVHPADHSCSFVIIGARRRLSTQSVDRIRRGPL